MPNTGLFNPGLLNIYFVRANAYNIKPSILYNHGHINVGHLMIMIVLSSAGSNVKLISHEFVLLNH